MSKFTSATDRDLIKRIDAACASVETAKATWFDRSVALGKLLKEAKQRHPAVADFEAFLQQTKVGINIRWAYECIAMAGDPKEAERLRTANKERVKKHREKKRLNKPKPTPEPAPKRKPEPEPEPKPTLKLHSAQRWLSEFQVACDAYLLKLTQMSDLKEADRIYAKVRLAAETKIKQIKEAA